MKVPALLAASDARVKPDEEFKKPAEALEERERRKADKTVSLNLEKRKAERAADEAEAEGDDAEGEEKDPADPVLDEALRVMVDYTG